MYLQRCFRFPGYLLVKRAFAKVAFHPEFRGIRLKFFGTEIHPIVSSRSSEGERLDFSFSHDVLGKAQSVASVTNPHSRTYGRAAVRLGSPGINAFNLQFLSLQVHERVVHDVSELHRPSLFRKADVLGVRPSHGGRVQRSHQFLHHLEGPRLHLFLCLQGAGKQEESSYKNASTLHFLAKIGIFWRQAK